MKNRELSILRVIGILWVLLAHLPDAAHAAAVIWLPPGTFALALFFFVSGCLFKEVYADHPGELVRRRFHRLVVPYFLYNLFYLGVTWLIWVSLGYWMGEPFSLYNFFITPFIEANQYHLIIPAWFLLQLFILQVVFTFLVAVLRRFVRIGPKLLPFFLAGALFGVLLAQAGYNKGLWLVLARTLFGLFFFFIGFLYRTRLENKPIFNTPLMFGVIGLQIFLVMRFRSVISFSLLPAVFNGPFYLPVLSGLTGIYLALLIARGLARVLPERDPLITIGQNTLHIAALHPLVYYLITLAAEMLKGPGAVDISITWDAYAPQKYWPVYMLAGLLVPTLLVMGANALRAWFSRLVVQVRGLSQAAVTVED